MISIPICIGTKLHRRQTSPETFDEHIERNFTARIYYLYNILWLYNLRIHIGTYT